MTDSIHNFSQDDDFLDYVDGVMSQSERDALEDRLGQEQPRLLESLKRIENDRIAIQQTHLEDDASIQPPEHLVDDCLAQLERSMLLDDELPLAPHYPMPRRSQPMWRRFSVAATFIALAGIAVIIIARSILHPTNTNLIPVANSDTTITQPLDTNITHNPDQPSDLNAIDPVFSEDLTNTKLAAAETDKPLVIQPLTNGGVASADLDVTTEVIPLITPFVPSDAVRVIPADVGLAINLTTDHSEATIATLRNLLKEINPNTPGLVVENALPFIQTNSNSDEHITGSDRLATALPANKDTNINRNGNRVSPISVPTDEWDAVSGDIPNWGTVFPVEAQDAYRRDGFAITIVGTPSVLRESLRTLLLNEEHATIRMVKNGQITSLEALIPPDPPAFKRWADSILWWVHPDASIKSAMLLAASQQQEAVIRIPVRLRSRPTRRANP